MSYDPTDCIAEILGKPARSGFDPASQNYQCPFIDRQCIKRSTASEFPYPVCVMKKRDGAPVCVCPKRFYEIDFLQDVIQHAWPGSPPQNPKIAREVKMESVGNVDFVIADTMDNGAIGQFVSVELQAIDITGTVRDAYDALLVGNGLDKKKSYGFNWKNVYKRYIHQLISKGFYHHHWGTKVVSVIQDEVYNYIKADADFMRSPDVQSPHVNIIFMSYRFEPDASGRLRPVLKEVEGTAHTNLQSAVLYKAAPSAEDFRTKISAALER